ncbi:MAG: GntR family transcriptional regulator [Pelagimonas sp.]|uniref:GntR family transcriptional regulator n=1 Tax=Pelagimonas sp. TaxID=2073170 RepID=UPI003D6B30A2
MKTKIMRPARSITDRVFDNLFQAITKLDLRPGERLSEADIAEQLGVSRQPVRDAFFRLSQRGYVEILPQRGTLVSRISEEQVLNAMFIRRALECACLQELPPLSADRLKSLADILDRQEQAMLENNGTEFNALDESFHHKLCDLAGRGHIWSLILEQKGHLDRVRWLTQAFHRKDSLKEHHDILDALSSGQTDCAKSLLKTHLSKAQQVLPQIRHDNPALFSQSE